MAYVAVLNLCHDGWIAGTSCIDLGAFVCIVIPASHFRHFLPWELWGEMGKEKLIPAWLAPGCVKFHLPMIEWHPLSAVSALNVI